MPDEEFEAGKRWVASRFRAITASADVPIRILGWSDLAKSFESVLMILHGKRRIPVSFEWAQLEDVPGDRGDTGVRSAIKQGIREVVDELRVRDSYERT